MAIISATYKYNVIYVYSIDDDDHRRALKIGKTEIETDPIMSASLTPNCKALNDAAHKRIHEQTQTAGVAYNLLYTTKAHFTDKKGNEMKYEDTDVQAILSASGYKKHIFPKLADKQPNEWFEVDLDTVLKAIDALKQGRSSIKGTFAKPKEDIHFRDEQEDAIMRTQNYFKGRKNRKMLWNAKMRFGKALCSLELIRRCGFKRTLILTHRPAVKQKWFDDYGNIDFEGYEYGPKPGARHKSGDKNSGQTFEYLQSSGEKFIYFVSMQDLRGSWNKDGSTKKNGDVFKTKCDLVIIDEAHEGTQTSLGKLVIRSLDAMKPCFLYLSGTLYNILGQFATDEIYTWDYVMEQDAKERWPKEHPDETNPYEGLAHMNILTYNLGTVFENYNHRDEDYFEFPEFFRTWTGNEDEDKAAMPANAHIGDFIHEADVQKFLDLLHKDDTESNYPYSTDAYRNYFAHALWVLPGVSAAAALSKMLRADDYFGDFKVVNVAGEGDKMGIDDDESVKASAAKTFEEKVKQAIKDNPRTITLTCYGGRMTTGVTIEEWTGVFMLAGGYTGNIAPYMQTIFRVQSPIKHHDYIKKECYAFDFAPDRTLTVIDKYIKKAERKKEKLKDSSQRKYVEDFTRFCSVIAIDGSKTIDYDAKTFIKRVNRIYAEHVITHGGKSNRLYNNYKDITDTDFKNLEAIATAMKDGGSNNGKGKGSTDVVVTEEGMTGGDVAKEPSTKGASGQKGFKKKKSKDPEKEQHDMVYDTLDQISIRLPMMVFGALDDVSTVSFEKFIRDIDEGSWNEFMPKGLSKEMFSKIAHLYNNDVFVAMAAEIIDRTKEADKKPVTERTKDIASILSLFHYPDNETVLTPWNVVNRHISETLDGWDFYDDTHQKGHELEEPRFVDQGKVTHDVFDDRQTKILELNSKSGVYPLYLAYSVFREQSKPTKNMFGETMDFSDYGKRKIWDYVVENNIYVVCKTPMAEKITQRVLAGFNKKLKLNTATIEDIVPRMRNLKR